MKQDLYAVCRTNNMMVTWEFNIPGSAYAWRKAESWNRQNYKVEVMPMSDPEVQEELARREQAHMARIAKIEAGY